MATKIMLISATDHVSGPAKGIFQLIENMDSSDIAIRLFTFQFNDISNNQFRAAAYERNIPVSLLYQQGRSYLSLIRQTVKAVRELKIDIVQTHGYKPTFLGFFASVLCGVKWVCFMHGTTDENLKVKMYNLVDNLLQRWADRTVLVSQAQRTRVLGGKDRKRVVVLHNAVDPMHPIPRSLVCQPMRARLGIPAGEKVVLSMGRFSPEKGMDILVEAFALLRAGGVKAHLVLVGDGQERPAIHRRIVDLGLNQVVHLPGFTKTPGDFMDGADLFVLPSRSEGIPNAILEAMAIGIPVVSTAVGGVPEIIEDGISGSLVPPENPDRLALGIKKALMNLSLRESIILGARKRVIEEFSVEARVRRMKEIYAGLVGE